MSQTERISRIAVLMFTDMADSVALHTRLGTAAYGRLLHLHNQLFDQALAAGTGKIHENPGDGFLAEFNTAADAINAALLFQQLIRETKWESEIPKIRIGLHQGQVAEMPTGPAVGGKILGMVINVTARLMGLAQGGQILMTRSVYDDARHFVRNHPASLSGDLPAPAIRWEAHGAYEFKGGDDAMEVFEVGAEGIAPFIAPPDSEKAWRKRARKGNAHPLRLPLIRAASTILLGLGLWITTLSDSSPSASYDYLSRLDSHPVTTNQVVVILMDNAAHAALGQVRGQLWDRALHTRLLNKLADDGCLMVVFDVFFRKAGDAVTDKGLATAIRRVTNVVLAAEQSSVAQPGIDAVGPTLPFDDFLFAAKTNWGVAWLDPDLDLVVRRQWPFPNPGPYPSLPETVARISGAKLNETPSKKWLRYYPTGQCWDSLSYHLALSKGPGYFRDKIVFIGNQPANSLPDREPDEFQTYQFRWTGETVGGVEILATSFLNLVNGDWYRRMAWPFEALIIVMAGTIPGILIGRQRVMISGGMALMMAFLFALSAFAMGHFANVWFPWLIVVVGQVPCAFLCALIPSKSRAA